MGIDAVIEVGVNREVSDDEIKRWSWLLAECIGARYFFIDKENGQGALSRSKKEEYGPWCSKEEAVKHAEMLEVHTWSRYYGEGYERGDILTLCGIAEWCEANLPGAVVYYGGDSDEIITSWSEEERKKLRDLLYTSSGRAYFRGGFGLDEYPQATPPLCSLCIDSSGFAQNAAGQGGKYIGVYCPGCGDSFTSRDAGKTWSKDEKKA